MERNKSVEAAAEVLSPTTEATLELGRKLITGTFDAYRDFAKTLISLSSSFILLYLGIIGFLNVKAEGSNLKVLLVLVLPPLLFIITCILFAISYMPRQQFFTIDDPNELTRLLVAGISTKKRYVVAGLVCFVAGLLSIIIVILYFVLISN